MELTQAGIAGALLSLITMLFGVWIKSMLEKRAKKLEAERLRMEKEERRFRRMCLAAVHVIQTVNNSANSEAFEKEYERLRIIDGD